MPHYLPANRFEWWQTWAAMTHVAPSGAVTDDPRVGEEAFHDEFLPDVATVVGSAVPTRLMRENRQAYTTVSWDDLADGASPNDVPGIGLTFITRAPESVPVIRQLQVRTIDGPNVMRKVVVNESAPAEPGHGGLRVDEVAPTGPGHPAPIGSRRMRSPLEIVFDQPQRSVALEFGYIAPDDPTGNISSWSVRLIARDRDGDEVARSYGSGQLWSHAISAYRVDYRLGVRDAQGRISAVELQFTHPYVHAPHLVDRGPRRISVGEQWVPYPQVIYRVWHEPLPPAAVLQGSTYDERDGDGNVIVNTADAMTLPFHCDRAAVFLRGFGLEYPDRPRGIYGLDVSVGATWLSERRLSIGGGGWLLNAESPTYPERARVDYTLLAWNSRLVDLHLSHGSGELTPAPSGGSGSDTIIAGAVAGTVALGPVGTVLGALAGAAGSTENLAIDPVSSGALQAPDPCPRAAGLSGDTSSGCGALFGALTRFGFRFAGRSQYLVKVWWAGDPAGPQRRDDGGRPVVQWALGSSVEGAADGSTPSHVRGVVLTGHSLTSARPPEPLVFTLLHRGPREPGEFQETEDRTRALGLGRASGLVAAPALLFFLFEPDGRVRQLDVEVKGINYDGAVVDWRMAAGVSTRPPGEDEDGKLVGGMPSIAAVVRRPYQAAPRLVGEGVRFDGGVVGTRDYVPDLPRAGGDYAPDQAGFLRNDGDAPALVTAARMAGPHAGDFDLRLLVDRRPWQREEVAWTEAEAAGRVFGLRETRRFPILLWPGERIIVGGSFRSVVEGMRWAQIVFETNDRARGEVSIDIAGQTGPNRALGHVLTWRRWRATVGTVVTVPAIVTSDGQTPLVITAIRIEDANSGFAVTGFGARWDALRGGLQIGPGNSHYFSISFAPTRGGLVSTRVIAETNAGDLIATLDGEGA